VVSSEVDKIVGCTVELVFEVRSVSLIPILCFILSEYEPTILSGGTLFELMGEMELPFCSILKLHAVPVLVLV
jgi:hypothetical protein